MKLLQAIKYGVDGYFDQFGNPSTDSTYHIKTTAMLTLYKEQVPIAIYSKKHQILWLKPYALLDPINVFFIYQIALACDLDTRFLNRLMRTKKRDELSIILFKEQQYVLRSESIRYQKYL